jgi:AhpC/TSA family
MKRALPYIFSAALALAIAAIPLAAARVGDSASDFTATGSNGQAYKLADFRGKFVVLEWHNQGCPYTIKHYQSGNMERLQKEWTAKGVVWFTVISSAPGQQGYVNAAQENDYMKRMNASPTAALLDPNGQLGHLYNAKTTPQMVVIGPTGTMLYNGAIDDRPSSSMSDISRAKNYLTQALTEAMEGKPVSTPTTRPYGCSVKYR